MNTSPAYPQLFSLAGKVALITGAGKGLGAEIAIALAEAGAAVAVAGHRLSDAQRTADTITAGGGTAIALAVDVSDEESVKTMVDATVQQLGRIDVLFNNAGISDVPLAPVHQYPTEQWRRLLSVDLDGVFFGSKHALGHMVEQGSGVIVNVSSIWGLAAAAGVAPMPGYTAAKGGVVNFSRDTAIQYAEQGIRVNALCPGFFRTELADNIYDNEGFVAAATALTPMKRIADASEIRGVAVFLASEASAFLTGQTITVDGGYLAV